MTKELPFCMRTCSLSLCLRAKLRRCMRQSVGWTKGCHITDNISTLGFNLAFKTFHEQMVFALGPTCDGRALNYVLFNRISNQQLITLKHVTRYKNAESHDIRLTWKVWFVLYLANHWNVHLCGMLAGSSTCVKVKGSLSAKKPPSCSYARRNGLPEKSEIFF